MLLAAICAGVGLFVTLAFEIIQIFPKVAGAIVGRNSLGANSALRLLIFNRAGAALFFPSFGFLVDSGWGFSALTLLSILALVSFSVFVMSLNVFFDRYLQIFARLFFADGARASISVEELAGEGDSPARLGHVDAFWFSALAGFFGCLGLTLPMLVGSLFPEYRLTLANTGFVFNSVFSVLTVFVIDRRLSEYCDQRSSELPSFSRATLIGRFAGALLLALVYLAASSILYLG